VATQENEQRHRRAPLARIRPRLPDPLTPRRDDAASARKTKPPRLFRGAAVWIA
jgi:hypothetical protein